jgi:hypothetical protein
LRPPAQADLNQLQIHLVKNLKQRKVVYWKLLQKPPGVGANAGAQEKDDNENENFPNANAVQVTTQFQYYKFKGIYDSETHEVVCDPYYATAADAASATSPVASDCTNAKGNTAPYTKTYYTIDPGTSAVAEAKGGNLGAYLGAHVAAFDAK